MSSSASADPVFILGIGGSTRPGSSTERVVAMALEAARQRGAETLLIDGASMLRMPIYAPEAARTDDERAFIAQVRRADGVIIGSPGYHGSVSGLVKNTLDVIEETAKDERPYLADRAVGCIVTAYGWQACGTTLVSMRSIVHALRGWPTPMGVALNAATPLFNAEGAMADPRAAAQIDLLAGQVMHFAAMFRLHRASAETYAAEI